MNRNKQKNKLKMNLQLFGQTGVNAAEANLNDDTNFIPARAMDIDFANIFGQKIAKLTELLGVHRKLPMTAGTTIRTYKSTVTLDNTVVEPGEIIPLSKVKYEPAETKELTWDKKRKATPVETIQRFGFNSAVQDTDNLLLRELQKELRQKLIGNLATGTKEDTATSLKKGLAAAWGHVQTIFEDDGVQTIAFVNTSDVADYLGDADITIQSEFGLNYVEKFLGVDVAIITSLIPKGTIYATAPYNLVLAYAVVNGGEIGKQFDFYTDETGVIGVLHDVNKQRLTAETITLSGIELFAERLDGVVKITIQEASI